LLEFNEAVEITNFSSRTPVKVEVTLMQQRY